MTAYLYYNDLFKQNPHELMLIEFTILGTGGVQHFLNHEAAFLETDWPQLIKLIRLIPVKICGLPSRII